MAAATSLDRGRVNVPLAALGGAALIHAILLAPLALGALGLSLEHIEDVEAPPLLIQLERRSAASRPPVRVTAVSSRPRVRRPLQPRPTPHRPFVLAGSPDEAAAVIDSRWRVRPAVGGPGWSDCPDAFGDPSAQNLCNERNRLRAAAASLRNAPSLNRVQPSDAPPTEAIARAAAANQAWRDYTRNDGPYPGLRSLFRDH